MIVTSDFEGGNAKIISVTDSKVLLEVELRDTIEDWFFWCFKVCGANGKTVTFEFNSEHRVGYYGASVSYDRVNWHWQYDKPDYNGKSFTYTFSEDEDEVYFAHDMVYTPKAFFGFAEKNNFNVETLSRSEKGRDIPYIDTKTGDECILLTARHHACESSGNYVLEGVLEDIIKQYSDKFRIICVPFVDYDGVIDGDQGKSRNGHDHNRDYEKAEKARYGSVAKLREIIERYNVRFGFDFHSPWHCFEENDKVCIPISHTSIADNAIRLSKLFEEENNSRSLPHYSQDNLMPNEKWNNENSPTFARYCIINGAEMAFTLETPYFMASNVMFTPERAKETGKCFLRALSKYLEL